MTPMMNACRPTIEPSGHNRRVCFDPLALLLDASLEGELELVKKTARQVEDPSAANDEGITALHNAICAGHFDIVRFLVLFGCDVNAQVNFLDHFLGHYWTVFNSGNIYL